METQNEQKHPQNLRNPESRQTPQTPQSRQMQRKPPTQAICTIAGHVVEVSITRVVPAPAAGIVGFDDLDPYYTDAIADELCQGAENGTFLDLTDTVTLPDGSEAVVEVHGRWRRVPDYDLWRRIFSWNYNRRSDESLTEQMFREVYGKHMGGHYYDKWLGFRGGSIEQMIYYFNTNAEAGQKFLAMVMECVIRYEARLARYRMGKPSETVEPPLQELPQTEPVSVPEAGRQIASCDSLQEPADMDKAPCPALSSEPGQERDNDNDCSPQNNRTSH